MIKIGFIGLGHMGLPMAINLLKKGHQVKGYDLSSKAGEMFALAGGHNKAHLDQAVIDCDIVITMLQSGSQVLEVYQNLFEYLSEGTLLIDCSTIDVETSRQLHHLGQSHHFSTLDAPVSGGTKSAQEGRLTFMVGGLETTFHQALPVLEAMGKKIIHTGPAGSGQAAKICNNMILGISMIAVSEAFVLAEKLHLSPQKLFEVVNNASGQCWSMSQYPPVPDLLEHVPASHQYQPGFAAKMMLKDLLLSQDCAKSVQLHTPLGAKATGLYEQWINQGHGEDDFSAIIKLIAQTEEA